MRKFKKILCLLIANILILSMTACHKNGQAANTGTPGVAKDAVIEDSSLIKQHVFREQELDLGLDLQNTEICGMTYLENRLHLLIDDGNSGYSAISMHLDGSKENLLPLETDASMVGGHISGAHFLTDGNIIGLYVTSTEYDPESGDIYREPEYKLIKWDSEGKLIENNSIDLSQVGINNVSQMILQKDGTLFVTYYNNDWSKLFVCKSDFASGSKGEKVEFPIDFLAYRFYPGETTDLMINSTTGLYTYHLGDAEPIKLMDFGNSDFASLDFDTITFLNDKEFVATYRDTTDLTLKLSKFTYVDSNEVTDKINIVLGCEYINSNLSKQIADFNKTNDTYRIVIKNYDLYNTMEDYSLGSIQLHNDIISGNMPDILLVNSTMNIDYLANKGLLVDVGELISKDKELANIEYLENVFQAFSVNDTLYTVVPSFSVSTMIARKDMVGNRTSWTMPEFLEYMDTLPDDIDPFGFPLLQDTMIYYLLQYCAEDFLDMNTGTCHFDSPEFIAWLEFAKTFPAELNESFWNDYDWNAQERIFRDKKAVLMSNFIWNMEELVYDIHGTLGSEASFVGFPGLSGNSSVIISDCDGFLLSSHSKNLEGAWSFVRYFLTEEYQTDNQTDQLPVMKKTFEEQLAQAAAKPYKIDDGTILEPFSQKEIDEIRDFIYSIEKRTYNDGNVHQIVTEEANSFFAGDKSAKEAAEIIQNRVQLYLDESR